MATSVLITGASGLIGTRLTELLLNRGHRVAHLGRSVKTGSVPTFLWNVGKHEADVKALEGVDTIIHLAGANVADKRWTASRRKEILDSRANSTSLLYDTLKTGKHAVRTFVSGSAIGYYGFSINDRAFTEDSGPGSDFLASVVKAWEGQADRIASLGIRVVKVRSGIALSKYGGALKKMALPVKWGIGSPLGSGRQWMSWIHIDDLCGIFIKSVEEEAMSGVYNATAPRPLTNSEFTKALAQVLHRPLWLPRVPVFALRLLVGPGTEIIVNGSNISSAKIQKAGFSFRFPELKTALEHLLRNG